MGGERNSGLVRGRFPGDLGPTAEPPIPFAGCVASPRPVAFGPMVQWLSPARTSKRVAPAYPESRPMQTSSWSPPPVESSLELRDYISVLRRGRRLIVLCVLVSLGAASAFTLTRTKIYAGVAEVLVKPPITTTLDSSLGTVKALNIDDERQLMLSSVVAQLAAAKLNVEPTVTAIHTLLKKVDVSIPLNTNVLQVRFSDPSPQAAADGAEAFAEAFLDYKATQANQDIQSKKDEITKAIGALPPGSGPSLAALRLAYTTVSQITVDPGEVIQKAEVPTKPSSPNLPVNMALVLFLGLFVGVVATYVRERMDDHLRGREDLEAILGVPVMTM